MMNLKEDELIVSIKDSAPEERRERILKALASAIRWYGSSNNVYDDDGQYLIVLAELMHEII